MNKKQLRFAERTRIRTMHFIEWVERIKQGETPPKNFKRKSRGLDNAVNEMQFIFFTMSLNKRRSKQ